MKNTNLNSGIYVNVPEMHDRCVRALDLAVKLDNQALSNAAQSVLSALILVLGKRRAYIPEQLRKHYNLLMENV
jgi:hypothetical protein